MLTLFVDKSTLTTHFKLTELQEYSKKHNARVIIRGHAKIIDGIVCTLADKSMIMCEALKAVKEEMEKEEMLGEVARRG